jgi:hypothetical protein
MAYLDEEFEMPDKMVTTMARILEQNNGTFSKRAKDLEFPMLNAMEIEEIEARFLDVW